MRAGFFLDGQRGISFQEGGLASFGDAQGIRGRGGGWRRIVMEELRVKLLEGSEGAVDEEGGDV